MVVLRSSFNVFHAEHTSNVGEIAVFPRVLLKREQAAAIVERRFRRTCAFVEGVQLRRNVLRILDFGREWK